MARSSSKATAVPWTAQALAAMPREEHAYLLDHGIDRKAYIQAFFENIDWDVVSQRLPQ
jgi:Fe-Mn family superoxide dismutase